MMLLENEDRKKLTYILLQFQQSPSMQGEKEFHTPKEPLQVCCIF